MVSVAPLGWVGVRGPGAGVVGGRPGMGVVVPPPLVDESVEVEPLDDVPLDDTGNPAGIANGSRTGSTITGDGARLGDSLPVAFPPVAPLAAGVVVRGEKLVASSSAAPPPPSSLSKR